MPANWFVGGCQTAASPHIDQQATASSRHEYLCVTRKSYTCFAFSFVITLRILTTNPSYTFFADSASAFNSSMLLICTMPSILSSEVASISLRSTELKFLLS